MVKQNPHPEGFPKEIVSKGEGLKNDAPKKESRYFTSAQPSLGGSLVWASARDFARTKSPADNVTVYGAGWWINAANADDIRPRGQGSALGPRDAFSAQGHEGQIIWVVPSRDLVIVRLGLMGNGGESWPALYDWAQKAAMTFDEEK